MLTVFFSDEPARDFDSSQRADAKRYARFFHAMRERGVLLPPSQWESWFVSTAHREEPTLEATLDAARYAFARVAP